MAFHQVEKGAFAFGLEKLIDTVSVRVSGPTAHISVSKDIYEKLKSPAAIKVMIGSGENSGFIALIPKEIAVNGCYALHKKERKLAISASKIGVVKGTRPTVHVSHEITEDGLIIDIRPLRQPVSVAA